MSRTTIKGTSLWAWLAGALFSGVGWIIVQVLKGVGWLGYRLLLWALAHPRTSISVGVLTGAVLLIGWKWIVGIIGVALLTGSVWKAAHRGSFEATVGAWLRTWHRKWWTYRRRWDTVMTRCGLAVEVDQERHLPQLRKVSTTPYWDRLAIETQIGQEVADFEAAEGLLRRAFEGERISVRELDPRTVGVDVMRRDPFRYETVPAPAMPASTEQIDYSALPIGVTEHLEPLTVSVVGGHTAVPGGSGAGKAGVPWGILRCLAPAIADGTVKPAFIDPKARELRQGIELVGAGVFNTPTPELTTRGRRTGEQEGPQPTGDYAVSEWDTVCLLERLVAEMEEANARGGEVGERDFVPTKETPLRLIVIDELLPLLVYWSRGALERIESALGLLLTQGRAAGFIVVGCIQEPTKDQFPIRDLFARRIGLRLPTESYTEAALADHAVERGAACHEIPESLPGVCFSFHEKDKKAIRARLGHVRNEDIAELVAYVKALRSVPSIARTAAPEVEYIPAGEGGKVIRLDGEADAA
jgi:S-DNA-T family DNA segregation ATPase FtsK/SpoIIIE